MWSRWVTDRIELLRSCSAQPMWYTKTCYPTVDVVHQNILSSNPPIRSRCHDLGYIPSHFSMLTVLEIIYRTDTAAISLGYKVARRICFASLIYSHDMTRWLVEWGSPRIECAPRSSPETKRPRFNSCSSRGNRCNSMTFGAYGVRVPSLTLKPNMRCSPAGKKTAGFQFFRHFRHVLGAL